MSAEAFILIAVASAGVLVKLLVTGLVRSVAHRTADPRQTLRVEEDPKFAREYVELEEHPRRRPESLSASAP